MKSARRRRSGIAPLHRFTHVNGLTIDADPSHASLNALAGNGFEPQRKTTRERLPNVPPAFRLLVLARKSRWYVPGGNVPTRVVANEPRMASFALLVEQKGDA